jgi:hypothetical protein
VARLTGPSNDCFDSTYPRHLAVAFMNVGFRVLN